MKTPDKSIEDTGERMIPAYHKGHMVFGEHIVRYESVLQIVNNKVVLDIASGSGYGTNLISTKAKKVYGVDVDPVAINYAKKAYSNNKTEFILGNGKTIPLDDNTCDVVISFETIEHIDKYLGFIKEINRVLKNDGLFILSTPNKIEFPKSNHYHVHEFVENELDSLLSKFFKYSKKYYQTTWLYNLLSEDKLLKSEWTSSIETIQTAPIKNDKVLYFFILCSNRKINETIPAKSAISEHWSARTIEESEQSIRKFIDSQGKVIKHQQNTIDNLSQELYNLRRKINKLVNNPVGKILKPVAKKIIK